VLYACEELTLGHRASAQRLRELEAARPARSSYDDVPLAFAMAARPP